MYLKLKYNNQAEAKKQITIKIIIQIIWVLYGFVSDSKYPLLMLMIRNRTSPLCVKWCVKWHMMVKSVLACVIKVEVVGQPATREDET